MRGRSFILVAASLVAACGGKVTWVEGGSEGGAPGSSSNASTSHGATTSASTGGSNCANLLDSMNVAAAAAQACNPTVSSPQCDGTAVVKDACGCPSLLLNEKQPDKVKAALAAYDAWVNAGCGPLGCGQACFPAVSGFCSPLNAGGGVCVQALPD